MSRQNGKTFYMMLLIIFIGFLIGIQFEYGLFTNMETNFTTRELASQVNRERELLRNVENKIETLEINYKKIIQTYSTKENEKYQAILQEKMGLAGYADVVGPGYTIIIDSNSTSENISINLESRRVLLNIVNDIKKNGGEAIAINGQRIVVDTDITLAGSLINVNNVPIGPPYKISVIGNMNKLNNYYTKESNYLKVIQTYFGLIINIEEHEEITITSIRKPKKNYYITS